MRTPQPQPVTMLMVTPEQLASIVEDAVSRANSGKEDESMTLTEAAKYLKISTKSMQRKIARGEIEPVSRRPLRIMRSALGGKNGR